MTEAVTFLLTDVEGSTRLWETRPDAMRRINERHDALVDQVVGAAGTVFRDRAEGDSSFAAFEDARAGIEAAVALQRAIEREPWPDDLTVRVRAALHTGRAETRDGQYYGPVVNRGVRLRALAHGGQVVVSEAVVAAVDALPDGVDLRDLGTHRLKDLAVPEHVFQVCAPDLDAQFPPLRSLDVVRNNLTTPTTVFVGRSEEQDALVTLLREQRLVTVTGSGGVGKTRLAREVAAALVEQFPDGVWFVDFTASRDAADVGRATADAVGAKDDPVRTPAEAVAEHLRTTRTLLVLDNCEHVAEAAGGLVTGVLSAAPDVRVLITSRQPIGVAGERVWRVPPLAGQTAVALFVDRARVAAPDRALDEADRAAAVGLCAQLDGIPLAIEMAAARVAELPSVAALAEALRDRLAVGATDDSAPSRQRTMRATIEWSHDLLRPEERRLLRRLAAFIGGFTLDAAEGVCADERLDAFDVLDLLGQLVAQSLVQADEDGTEFRYRLLEVVREFAGERLAEGPENETVRSRHQAWFMHLAEREGGQLYFGAMANALDALERELPNLRRAIEWDGDAFEEDVRYRLLVALHRLWVLRGYVDEGLRLAELVFPTPVERRGWRASALVNAAALAEQSGRADLAGRYYRDAAALFAEIDADIGNWGAELDDETIAGHRRTLAGQQAWCQIRQASLLPGQPWLDAQALVNEALVRAEVSGGHTEALVSSSAAVLAFNAADYSAARELWTAGLPIFEEFNDLVEVSRTRLRLGGVEWAEGRFAAARSLYEAARADAVSAGDSAGEAQAVQDLADLAVLVGSPDATALVDDARTRAEVAGDRRSLAMCAISALRAGRGGAEECLAAVRAVHDVSLVVDALLSAVQMDPSAPETAARAAEAASLVGQLAGWRAARAEAALAVATGDKAHIVRAATMLGSVPHPTAIIDVLRMAMVADPMLSARDELQALLRDVLDGLGVAGADAGDLRTRLTTWAAALHAVIERT